MAEKSDESTPALANTFRPAIFQNTGEQVWVRVLSHFRNAALSSPPSNPDSIGAVPVAPPGLCHDVERRAWFQLTPANVVTILAEYGQWAWRELPLLRIEAFSSDLGAVVLGSAVWFLDNYWPALRRGIVSFIKVKHWPTNVNPMLSPVEAMPRDSCYAWLGVKLLDRMQRAVFGMENCPALTMRVSDSRGEGHAIGVRAVNETLWMRAQAERMGKEIPTILNRLAKLGTMSDENRVRWVRGLEAELRCQELGLPVGVGQVESGSSPLPDEPNAPANAPVKIRKSKRSTERGEGRAKLIAALNKHHKYAEGGCLHLEPIGNNILAEMAKVAPSTASSFFKAKFKGHGKYRACCRNSSMLVTSLKMLNDEFSPHNLYGDKPPEKVERENE